MQRSYRISDTLTEVQRHMSISSSKFCRFETSYDSADCQRIVFKSARNGYRAPLLA